MKSQPNRIPNEKVADCHAWAIPEIDSDNILPSAEKEERERREQEARARGEVIGEDIDSDEINGPITAAELEKMTEQAHQEGYAAGFEQGHAEGLKTGSAEGEKKAYAETKEKLENNLISCEQLIKGLTDPFESHTQQLQELILTTVLSLSASIIRRETSIQPIEIEKLVDLAIAALPKASREISLQLNPDDIAMLQEHYPNKVEQWKMQADPELSRGGLIVNTNNSTVDFSIERQLAMLEEKLLSGELSVPEPPATDDAEEQRE